MLDQVTSTGLTSEEQTTPNPVPMVTASWQVVEGVKLGEEEGMLWYSSCDDPLPSLFSTRLKYLVR